MQDRQKAQDYRAILLADTPLIDVRAPIEFEQGAMPGAINLPLMMDDERAAVGTCYKRQGADAALALGHRLVCGDIRQQRLEAWKAAYQRFPTGICAARAAVSGHISYNVGCKKQGLTARLLKAAIKRCARQQFRRPGNWRKNRYF